MNRPGRLLDPKEILRVMDAAQVIHERRAALSEHEELDREGTVREIQIMYEELGDLVDTRVIEEALDEYLARRYAFSPAPPTISRRLALLYVRRGRVAKRVLLPAAGVAAVVWGGLAGVGLVQQPLARCRRRSPPGRRCGPRGSPRGRAYRDRGTPGQRHPAGPSHGRCRGVRCRARFCRDAAWGNWPPRSPRSPKRLRAKVLRARPSTDSEHGWRLPGATWASRATKSPVRGPWSSTTPAWARWNPRSPACMRPSWPRRSRIWPWNGRPPCAAVPDARLAARDLEGLEEIARDYRRLRQQVATEYGIVIVGGVWRSHTELDDVRNHYLRVRAVAPDGTRVPVVVRNEEYGTTAEVTEWAERVPKEVYDRVGADKKDNGIIDDDDFGFKRRGFVTAERRYEDLGQITEW